MSEQLLLLNPRRRRRRNPHRRRRSVARFFGRTRRRRLANPRRHRVRGHYSRDRGHRVYVRSHMANPRRRRRSHRRHYRHLGNPRSLSAANLMRDYVMPAGIGAVGAVGLKVGWGYLSPHLPTAVQSGWGALGAQSAVVLAAGWGLGKAMPRHRRSIALGVVGALTVIAYTAAVQLLQTYAPNLQGLRDYTDYRIGAYMGAPGVPALVAPTGAAAPRLSGFRGVGMISPAPAVRGLGAYMTYGNQNM